MAVLDGVCPRVLRRHTAVHCGIASPRFRCCWTLDSRGARVTFRRHPEAQDGEQMVNPRFKALRRHARTLLAAAQQAGVQAWSASSKIRRPGHRASCMILLQGEATDLSVGTANQEGTIRTHRLCDVFPSRGASISRATVFRVQPQDRDRPGGRRLFRYTCRHNRRAWRAVVMWAVTSNAPCTFVSVMAACVARVE